MTSLLIPHEPSNDGRNGRNDLLAKGGIVWNRWMYVLELSMAGHSVDEICEMTNYGRQTIYKILRDERIVAMKQMKMAYYDDAFMALYPKVVDAIRDGLDVSEDAKVRLTASKLWLKAHGREQPAPGSQKQLTAEDVVSALLAEAQKHNGDEAVDAEVVDANS